MNRMKYKIMDRPAMTCTMRAGPRSQNGNENKEDIQWIIL